MSDIINIVSIRSTQYCMSQNNVVTLHDGIIFLILKQKHEVYCLPQTHASGTKLYLGAQYGFHRIVTNKLSKNVYMIGQLYDSVSL